MRKHTDPGRRRGKLVAVLTATATLGAALALSLGSIARADTSTSPDPNTKAAYGPLNTATASVGSNPATTLAAAAEGSSVSIHVDGPAGTFHGVTAARLCRPGQSFNTHSQLSPGTFGNCINQPFTAGSDDDFVQAASGDNTTVDFVFKVGMGTESAHPGPGAAITCGPGNPCAIWLEESIASTAVFKHYDITYATNPGAPGAVVTSSSGAASVAVSPPAITGNAPLGTYTVALSGGDCATIAPACNAQTGAGPTFNFPGLTNFQSYSVSTTVQNDTAGGGTPAHYTSAPTAGTASPAPTNASNLSGSPGNHKVDLSWTAAGGGPVSYDVEYTDVTASGSPTVVNTGSSTPAFTVTGLTNGDVYSFRVRGVYAGGGVGNYSAPTTVTPNGVLITQTINVRRPQGALVLTQICGTHAPGAVLHPGDPGASAPTTAGGPDPLYSQYPYPTDASGEPIATYPTDCGVNLGTARLITTGTGAGHFFAATGDINQVTIVDTRDTDPGFSVNGQVGNFTAPTGTFSGNQLGWAPHKTSDSGTYADTTGSYTQTVTAGALVPPNTAGGLGTSAVLGSAAAGQGLGIGVLDAALTLWIPIYAKTGNYSGTLTITAV